MSNTRRHRPQIPTVGREIRQLDDRLYAEEMGRVPSPHVTSDGEVIFSRSGSLSTGASPRWYPYRSMHVISSLSSVTDTSTGDTVIEIRKNGTTFHTVTFSSANSPVHMGTTSEIFLEANVDYLDVNVTDAGSHVNPSLQVRFMWG